MSCKLAGSCVGFGLVCSSKNRRTFGVDLLTGKSTVVYSDTFEGASPEKTIESPREVKIEVFYYAENEEVQIEATV